MLESWHRDGRQVRPLLNGASSGGHERMEPRWASALPGCAALVAGGGLTLTPMSVPQPQVSCPAPESSALQVLQTKLLLSLFFITLLLPMIYFFFFSLVKSVTEETIISSF